MIYSISLKPCNILFIKYYCYYSSILIQTLGEKIGFGWQPPPVDGEESSLKQKWANPTAARKLFQYATIVQRIPESYV